MALRQLIENQVDLAFDLAGNLTKEIKFVNGSPGTYNFTTQTTTVSDSDTETIYGIVENIRRVKSADRPIKESRVIFKKADVGVLDTYDTAKFNNQTWKVSSYTDNEYTVTAIMTKEI